MESELQDYSRFVSNGEDVAFSNEEDPKPVGDRPKLEVWADKYSTGDRSPVKS